MCLRINDLSQLRKTLRIIFEKLDSLWSSASTDEAGSLLISTEEYMNKAAVGLINILVYRVRDIYPLAVKTKWTVIVLTVLLRLVI